jgi:hypothetical protein
MADPFQVSPPDDTDAFGDNSSDLLAQLMSPAEPQTLVHATPPPSTPPQSAPGQSTPRTGNLSYPPQQAQPKNADRISPAQIAASGSQAAQINAAGPGVIPSLSSGAMPSLGSPASPRVIAPRGTLQGDTAEVNRVQNTGSGISQIKNPFWRGLAEAGDIGLRVVAPGIEPLIPGTEGRHGVKLEQAAGRVAQDTQAQQAAAQLQDTQQQTEYRKQQAAEEAAKAAGTAPVTVTPEMHAQNPNLVVGTQIIPAAYGKTVNTQTRNTGLQGVQAEKLGLKAQTNPDGTTTYVDDPNSSVYQSRKVMDDVRQSQEAVNQARAELAAAGNDPTSPAYKLAQQKLQAASQGHDAAMIRAQAQLMNAYGGNYGTDERGNPLPGAMVSDNGQPIGAHFQANVRPTGQERNKADMAASASEQLSDIKKIIRRHPTLFGPGYGQASAFRQWLGSEDPDAQAFVAARTIAGDHLAGTFGGRSEAALAALDKAIGQFKDNPKAALAGIDQLTKANTRFIKAGTPRTVGSNAAQPGGVNPPNQPNGSVLIRKGNGQAITSQTAAAYLQKAGGDPAKARSLAQKDGWKF